MGMMGPLVLRPLLIVLLRPLSCCYCFVAPVLLASILLEKVVVVLSTAMFHSALLLTFLAWQPCTSSSSISKSFFQRTARALLWSAMARSRSLPARHLPRMSGAATPPGSGRAVDNCKPQRQQPYSSSERNHS